MSGNEAESPQPSVSNHESVTNEQPLEQEVNGKDEEDSSHADTDIESPSEQDIRITVEDADGQQETLDHVAGTEVDHPTRSAVNDRQEEATQTFKTEPDLSSRPIETTPQTSAQNNDETPSNTQGISSAPSDDGSSLPTESAPASIHNRQRSESRSTTRSLPVSSTVFVVHALETIGASREARRSKEFSDAVQAALTNIKNTEHTVDPEVIFRPLQLATKTFNVQLQVVALDCIGKLISYSYFAFPVVAVNQSDAKDTPPLIERAIEAICDCFENEATSIDVQQQIVKSLLAAVLDDKIVVHGAGLLKAVRQIYNIFIYSKSSQNQQVAQGSLTQMVATVFERVQARLDQREVRMREAAGKSEEALSSELSIADSGDPNDHVDEMEPQEPAKAADASPNPTQEKLTLQSFENNKNLDDSMVADSAPTTVTRARKERKNSRMASLHEDREDGDMSQEDEDEIYVKDAFLVFRSLCKLSQKVLSHDQQHDLRSQNMRSKLLSLHLIHHVINNYTTVFTSSFSTIKSGTNDESTSFMQVAKPHLCLSLSRNASSSVPRVYEVCCQIFWLSIKHLRVILKKELEVFLKEIYLAVLEKRSAPLFQKQMFMDVLERLSGDPRALVEIYLNYDCDRTALDNMYQRIIEHLARICSTSVAVTAVQQQEYQEQQVKNPKMPSQWHSRGSLLPGLSTASMDRPGPPLSSIPQEYVLRQQSLRCLVDILSSLDNWSSQLSPEAVNSTRYPSARGSYEDTRESIDPSGIPPPSPRAPILGSDSGVSTPVAEDDPNEIEKIKLRKTALNEAIRQFNFKPTRGIKAALAGGFIRSEAPEDIARFLLNTEGLDKALLGEYLGEGDELNIAIMHAFVDQMEFAKRRFVDALRQFLQSFRLPGEGQKIDRFMLKFAERYLKGNPNAFANADTAYVLAYSVVMLNTDQHSIRIKGNRMTPEDFIKNNRGINDGQDLPPEYLTSIYEEIASNEIVLNSERERAADMETATAASAGGLASRAVQGLANVGRDLQQERYAAASEEMANKTEQLYRTLIRAQKRSAVRDARLVCQARRSYVKCHMDVLLIRVFEPDARRTEP